MKLRVEKFEELAQEKGYRNGYELSRDLGCGNEAYKILKQGNRIGHDIVAELYNRFGEEAMIRVINFEEETVDGFTNKYVKIGNKLC